MPAPPHAPEPPPTSTRLIPATRTDAAGLTAVAPRAGTATTQPGARIADLMQEGGMLTAPLNVAPLVVR